MGVDSNRATENNEHVVYQYTGSEAHMRTSRLYTMQWLHEVQERGAGEVVLNCMGSDGVGTGYDVAQLKLARARLHIPLVASGGAGRPRARRPRWPTRAPRDLPPRFVGVRGPFPLTPRAVVSR